MIKATETTTNLFLGSFAILQAVFTHKSIPERADLSLTLNIVPIAACFTFLRENIAPSLSCWPKLQREQQEYAKFESDSLKAPLSARVALDVDFPCKAIFNITDSLHCTTTLACLNSCGFTEQAFPKQHLHILVLLYTTVKQYGSEVRHRLLN